MHMYTLLQQTATNMRCGRKTGYVVNVYLMFFTKWKSPCKHMEKLSACVVNTYLHILKIIFKYNKCNMMRIVLT